MGFLIFILIVVAIIAFICSRNSSKSQQKKNKINSPNVYEISPEEQRKKNQIIEQDKLAARKDAVLLAEEWKSLNKYYELPDFEVKRKEAIDKMAERILKCQTIEGAIEMKRILSEPTEGTLDYLPYYFDENRNPVGIDDIWRDHLQNDFIRLKRI